MRPSFLTASGPWFAALFAVALLAFWPSYLSRIGGANGYMHLHAVTASAWMILLVAQPLAIRSRRIELHRMLGRASYALAPVLLGAMVLLANDRIKRIDPPLYHEQTYGLYLQLSLALLWALCYGLAVAFRRKTAFHARFMVCTGLTLIDPVAIRLLFWVDSTPDWNYQWLTFGLTDLVFLALIAMERRAPSGRAVFPGMLAVFILLQLPAVLLWWKSPQWQDFARWFAALPLT